MDATDFQIQLKDIPDVLQGGAERRTRDYSVGIFLDGELAGSGTLIAWDDCFGILTAQHVPQNPDDSSRRFDFSRLLKNYFRPVSMFRKAAQIKGFQNQHLPKMTRFGGFSATC
jgi:hypothetical protein